MTASTKKKNGSTRAVKKRKKGPNSVAKKINPLLSVGFFNGHLFKKILRRLLEKI
jgi:hypothetical protein